ncbi:MAG TPA: hypothetical protein VJW20_10170 [Candidatus Angelobacter sp.]|nr:hypothetical protein [Candidatus Angelobacter sp.]
MKVSLALLISSLLLFAVGCGGTPAVSLNSLYTKEQPPSREPGIEGKWLPEEPGSDEAKNLDVRNDGSECYAAKAQKPAEKDDRPSGPELYSVCLVRLQDKLFFDSELLNKQYGAESVSPYDLGDGVVRGHIIGQIWLLKDMLRVARLDSDWIEKNTPENFHVMNGSEAIITASTADLRKLVLEHSGDDSIWGSFYYLCRPDIDCVARATEDRLARYPNDAKTLQKAAVFFLSRGDNDRAVALMQHAVEAAPDQELNHAYLALALASKRDFAGVRRELLLAQKLDKEDPETYTAYIAISYYLEGNFPEAARVFSQVHATEKEPSAQTVLWNYFSLARAGRHKEADAFLSRETAHFTGSAEDNLLLREAAGHVTNPPWADFAHQNDQEDESVVFLYAENCLVQGDLKSARNALQHIINKQDSYIISKVISRLELARLDSRSQ